jgi:iron complex transport system substrate-binding protein
MVSRIFAVLFLSIGFAFPAFSQTTITDSGGREVKLPGEIKKIFPAGPPASVLLYTLAPDKMLGWTRELTPEQKRFIAAPYASLPTLGRLTGKGDTVNAESVLSLAPDLIFDSGTVNPTYISLADRVQSQLSIPYLLLDGSFAKLPETYRLLGRAIGKEKEADDLASSIEASVTEIRTKASGIPAEQRPRVYIGRGPNGLQGGSGSQELLSVLQIANASPNAGKGGATAVSLEDLLTWNPDIILLADAKLFTSVASTPVWKDLAAVQKNRVYLIPNLPFDWVDAPPGVNRLMGLRWLANLAYPDHFKDDIRVQAKDFYKKFYHVDLSDSDLDVILKDAVAPAK